jgi:diguanylate cyclase
MPHMAEVADYLRARNLPPLPVHYEAAWIALGGPIDAVPPAGPSAVDLCAEALDRVIGDARGTLNTMSTLLSKSRAETAAYGTALEHEAGALDRSPDVLEILISLTRRMIDHNRLADQKMRAMGGEMDALQGHLAEARTVATRDPLTGLDNRRASETRLEAAIARSVAGKLAAGTTVALAYCDIDHFKAINDRLGHEVGDRVLKLVARTLMDGVGPGGHAGRYGGEEFLLVFDGISIDEAEDRIDAVRRDLASRTLRVRDTGEAIGTVTFSAGLVAWKPGDGRDTLMHRADEALYRAKGLGRNRIERG